MTDSKVLIVGSGPAALTAAIYAARANLQPTLFEDPVEAGGALMGTTEVENFPGFPAGIMGPDLMAAMREQALRFGTTIIEEAAVAVKLTPTAKGVKTAGGLHKAPAIIVATGSAHRTLGIPGEAELSGRGVSYCATCDGSFFREQVIHVVGGGDSALEEALFLTKFSSEVHLLLRGETMRASKIMQERVQAHESIRLRYNVKPEELLGSSSLEQVRLATPEGIVTEEAGGFFIAIGHDPRSTLFQEYLPTNDLGYLLSENNGHGQTATAIPGVFLAGDVADHRYRQAITAAATGAQAAIDTEKWLESIR